ncbi:hypothetical protein POM88_011530 [Heracleum sosnowskyi]|uniref:F-box domain-containing protein n=1 Tax=Heracleum sosnowskyi TaxID=360622 RepID=A0AAD8IWE4_9APIA|nr:hypothetical protein POM88_011530 [Heracleum sosnowskyi]
MTLKLRSSQTAEFYAVVKLEIFKKISTSMLAPVTVDTAYFLLDFKSSLCLDKFKDQLFEVFVSTNGDYESQNKIVHIHIMLPERGTLVHKSMSPCWLSSHSTICAHVDLMGDILGMNVLPQEEHTGEIVSCTSPLDACGKLSIMSRSFWSDAKFDNVWERFLSDELISHQAVSDQWMFYDPCKNIDSDTLLAFPTKKYFWLDKLSGNKCFGILSLPLSTIIFKSLSLRWPLLHNTMRTYVDVMGGVSGLNALPQELIEEIVSRTRPVDACGNLSIVSRSFQSAAKSDHVWERFLPADLISRRAKPNESHSWIFVEDPWKKIDADTLKAFATKKDLYLFLSDNPLIIDDGDMYFWLDKLSGKKCFYLVPEKLSKPEPDGWNGTCEYIQLTLPFKIEGKISTSLLSPNTAYTAYLWFDFTSSIYFGGFGEEEPLQTFVGFDGGCGSECESKIVYIPFMPSEYQRGTKILKCRPPDMPVLSGPQYPRRTNGNWYELELGDYFNKEGAGDKRELMMCLSEVKTGEEKGGIDLKGIVIRPKNCQKIPCSIRAISNEQPVVPTSLDKPDQASIAAAGNASAVPVGVEGSWHKLQSFILNAATLLDRKHDHVLEGDSQVSPYALWPTAMDFLIHSM